jgi:hypothetical protein
MTKTGRDRQIALQNAIAFRHDGHVAASYPVVAVHIKDCSHCQQMRPCKKLEQLLRVSA